MMTIRVIYTYEQYISILLKPKISTCAIKKNVTVHRMKGSGFKGSDMRIERFGIHLRLRKDVVKEYLRCGDLKEGFARVDTQIAGMNSY